MSSRYSSLERDYRRRMAVSYPLSTLLILVSLLSLPGKDRFIATPKTVGLEGTLALLPEVDIIPEELDESRLTAAPRASAPSDFQVLELDFAESPNALPAPKPVLTASELLGEFREEPAIPNLEQARRTTGHPVLGAADYVLLYFERPVYPSEAIQLGIQGQIEVIILVDTNGRVIRTQVANPGRIPILEQAAETAVKKSLFRPYVLNGQPTAFWVKVPFEFRLLDSR